MRDRERRGEREGEKRETKTTNVIKNRQFRFAICDIRHLVIWKKRQEAKQSVILISFIIRIVQTMYATNGTHTHKLPISKSSLHTPKYLQFFQMRYSVKNVFWQSRNIIVTKVSANRKIQK